MIISTPRPVCRCGQKADIHDDATKKMWCAGCYVEFLRKQGEVV